MVDKYVFIMLVVVISEYEILRFCTHLQHSTHKNYLPVGFWNSVSRCFKMGLPALSNFSISFKHSGTNGWSNMSGWDGGGWSSSMATSNARHSCPRLGTKPSGMTVLLVEAMCVCVCVCVCVHVFCDPFSERKVNRVHTVNLQLRNYSLPQLYI